MSPAPLDEALRDELMELVLDLLDGVEEAAEKRARFRAWVAEHEPLYPGLEADFAATLEELGFLPPVRELPVPTSLPGLIDLTEVERGGFGIVWLVSGIGAPVRRPPVWRVRRYGEATWGAGGQPEGLGPEVRGA